MCLSNFTSLLSSPVSLTYDSVYIIHIIIFMVKKIRYTITYTIADRCPKYWYMAAFGYFERSRRCENAPWDESKLASLKFFQKKIPSYSNEPIDHHHLHKFESRIVGEWWGLRSYWQFHPEQKQILWKQFSPANHYMRAKLWPPLKTAWRKIKKSICPTTFGYSR